MKVGDEVEWTSQSQGNTRTKRGKILMIVPAKTQPDFRVLEAQHRAKSAYGGGSWRNQESYIVLVPGKTDCQKPTLYWPRVSALKPA